MTSLHALHRVPKIASKTAIYTRARYKYWLSCVNSDQNPLHHLDTYKKDICTSKGLFG